MSKCQSDNMKRIWAERKKNGYKMPEEWRENIQKALKGKSNSGAFKVGDKGFWTGKKRPNMTGGNHPMFGKKMSQQWIDNLSNSHKGIPCSEQAKQKLRIVHLLLGTKPPVARGNKNHNWKGGITPINLQIRQSMEYKNWRRHVFQRDNYTCQACGDNRGGNLNADHELPFALYPDLRLEILNGRTLCVPCHKKTPSYGDIRATRELQML